MRATTVLTAFFPTSLTPTLSPGGERGSKSTPLTPTLSPEGERGTILPVPVISVGRQFGAGRATPRPKVAARPKAGFFPSQNIAEGGARPPPPQKKGRGEARRTRPLPAP